MSLRIELHHYSKHKNNDVDKKVFEAVTNYEVLEWRDEKFLQILDIKKKPPQDEVSMMEEIVTHVSVSNNFRGWLSCPDYLTDNLYYTPCHEINLKAVEFCSMTTPFEIKPHYEERQTESCQIVASFEHDIQRIMIYICENGENWHKINIQYQEIHNHVVQQITSKSGEVKLVLSLKSCPSFWKSSKEDVERRRKNLARDHYRSTTLDRILRFKTPWNRIKTLTRDHDKVKIPRCSTIVLTYSIKETDISRIVSGFKKHSFQCFFTRFDELRYPEQEEDEAGDWIEDVMKCNPDHEDNINLRYSLKCLDSLGFQFVDKLSKTSPGHKKSFLTYLKSKVARSTLDNVVFVTETIYKLVQSFDRNPFLDPCLEFDNIHELVHERYCGSESHYQYIKRIIVTPSRTIFVPPEPIAINRILRAHLDYIDNFARVCFRDEDFSQLNVHSEEATRNVRTVIDHGLSISREITFRFLGCSNSQLRSQGLWLFYPQCPVTVESIRDSIGDLNEMRTIQKYVTRMGLAFTATDFSLEEEVEIEEIEEVETVVGDKRHVFSDGCGSISPGVRDLLIRRRYGGEDAYYKPVAFQIRVGGCKGMVAVNDKLSGLKLQIRPSMMKFKSHHNKLEPCGYSSPRDLAMNRQVIAILRAQGVPDNNFVVLQNRSLLELADMLTDEDLASHEMGQMLGVRRSDLRNKIRVTTEPFLRRQLVALYKFKVRDAIQKSRFSIDKNKGRQMKGVIDETRTLNYGEVFVQYTVLDGTLRTREVLTGEVFITKNPCLHPGDLKRVIAVDVPALHHLYDVIVFPAKGKRPHPNELSGSDLDGDEYFVCWEKELMPSKDVEPAEYYIATIDPHRTDAGPAEITEELVNNFVFDYITKGSKLGMISNAHAIWADRLATGVLSEMCRKLAHKHSDAVDFVKTGIAPEFSYAERSLIYPDWMMKPDKAAYSSKTAIGTMFHVACGLEHSVLHLDVDKKHITPDPLLSIDDLTEEEIGTARGHYRRYCVELSNLMLAYGILDEGDIAAGCLNTIKTNLAKEHERNYDMRENCMAMYRALQRKYSRTFFEELGVRKSCWRQEEERALRQAAAWYHVTYTEPESYQGLVLLSFPWCVSNVLLQVSDLKDLQGVPNSVRASLRTALKSWYTDKYNQGKEWREIGEKLHRWLGTFSGVRNLSRYTYGVIPNNTYLFYIPLSPRHFAKGPLSNYRHLNEEAWEHLRQIGADLSKCSSDWGYSELHLPGGRKVRVVLVSDEDVLAKVNIVTSYCRTYPVLAPVIFLLLSWADQMYSVPSKDREPDLALALIEFMLRKRDSQVEVVEGIDRERSHVTSQQSPHKTTATLYLEFIRFVILNPCLAGQCVLGEHLLANISEVLASEKTLISLMKEYHFISYTLTFESVDSYTTVTITRKTEKKMCYNIARATHFCTSYFNTFMKVKGKDKLTDKDMNLKIRETDLGGTNALVLEIWGDNPQKINDFADALEIDETKFRIAKTRFFVKKETEFNQVEYIAPAGKDKRKSYFTFRKYATKPDKDPRDADVRHDIVPVYYNNRSPKTSMAVLISGVLQKKVQLLRDVLYNTISHGDITLSTNFGKLKVKMFLNGNLEKEAVNLSSGSKSHVMGKLRGTTRRSKSRQWYKFKVIFEGVNYSILFEKISDNNHKLASLSLGDMDWCDMMIVNNSGMDMNLAITSTHTMCGEALNPLTLTYELYNKHKKWIEKVDRLSGITLLDRKEIPCWIESIEHITSTEYIFDKDTKLRGIILKDQTTDLYRGTVDGNFVKYLKTNQQMKLEAKVKDLDDIEFVKAYLGLAVNLAKDDRVERPARHRCDSGFIPRRPYSTHETGSSSVTKLARECHERNLTNKEPSFSPPMVTSPTNPSIGPKDSCSAEFNGMVLDEIKRAIEQPQESCPDVVLQEIQGELDVVLQEIQGEEVVNEEIQKNVVNEEIQADVVNEEIQEDVVNEEIQENVDNEEMKEDVVNEEIQEDVVNEEASNKVAVNVESDFEELDDVELGDEDVFNSVL